MNPLNWIAGWWRFSRIIFLNGVALLVAALPDLLGYAVGLDYNAFFQHELALVVGIGVNIASIILRINTTGPVGQYLDPAEHTPVLDDDNAAGDHYTGDSHVDVSG